MTSNYSLGIGFYIISLFLIILSIISVAMASLNLNNIIPSNKYIYTKSINYKGIIGESPPFCIQESFLGFAWMSGFLSFLGILTGTVGFGIKSPKSKFTLLYILLSALTIFGFITILIVSSLVLKCHVTLTGKIPLPSLIIAIFSIFELFLIFFLFIRIIYIRGQYINDLKQGHPLPDPYDLRLDPTKVIYYESKNIKEEEIDEEKINIKNIEEEKSAGIRKSAGNGESAGIGKSAGKEENMAGGSLNLAYHNRTFLQIPNPSISTPIISVFDNSTFSKQKKQVLNI